MTFSIAARCRDTGMVGIAISSSSPAVAARCAHVRAGVGAVASQNITDPALGPALLDRMAAGDSAPDALTAIRDTAPHIEFRQLLAVDRAGRTALYSGSESLGTVASAQGDHAVAAGNLLAHNGIPAAMLAAFNATSGALPDRLLSALRAGRDAGGEAGPVHSAGLVVADRLSWPAVDLRVDWSEDDPISALEKIWTIYCPQVKDYIMRAANPRAAPSFAVTGDP